MKTDYNKIKRELERMRCPEHNEKPKISILNSNIKIDACCEAFVNKVKIKSKDLFEQEASNAFKKGLDDMFK